MLFIVPDFVNLHAILTFKFTAVQHFKLQLVISSLAIRHGKWISTYSVRPSSWYKIKRFQMPQSEGPILDKTIIISLSATE
jgi:hypothetical protein